MPGPNGGGVAATCRAGKIGTGSRRKAANGIAAVAFLHRDVRSGNQTARMLGLTVPDKLLVAADEVRATRDPSTTSLGLHLDEDDAQYQVYEALALRINPHAIACGYF